MTKQTDEENMQNHFMKILKFLGMIFFAMIGILGILFVAIIIIGLTVILAIDLRAPR